MARVSDARWAQMRKQRRSSLQDRCQIRAAVAGTAGVNGSAQTWPTVTQTVDCTIVRKLTNAGGESLELSSDDQWEVIVMDDITIAVPDQISPTTGRYVGQTLQAYDISRPGSFDQTNRVKCVQVVD